jgi:hypothetical protein
LSCHCGVSVALFVVVTLSLLSSFLPLLPTANERWLHAAASHLPPITVLITVDLAIDSAIVGHQQWMALFGWLLCLVYFVFVASVFHLVCTLR